MSGKAFSKVLRGLEEAKAYLDGERDGYKVTVPPSVDVKSIRKGLRMTQAAFSDSFGFSLDAVKHWEGRRRTPEVPARAYLLVIQRNPAAVLEALRPSTELPASPGSARSGIFNREENGISCSAGSGGHQEASTADQNHGAR